MRLTDLTKAYRGDFNPEIKGLTHDSRRVQEGWLFAALPGGRDDGRHYIVDAIRHGAVAVLTEPGTPIEETGEKVAHVVAENPRRCLAQLAAKFYGQQPAVTVAVTGTNGKTSTVDFTRQIWQIMGLKAASLGTLGVRGRDLEKGGSLTTPDPVALHAELADLASAGITHLAMEASSHGLHQSRLDGVRAGAAGFTNLSHDHLDYHGSMEDYLIAKAHLFEEILSEGGVAVLNADIPEFEDLCACVAKRDCRILSYGRRGRDIVLKDISPDPGGQQVTIEIGGESYRVNIPLVGAFQVMNALCALGLVMAEAPDDAARTREIVPHLADLKGVPGRLELVPGPGAGAVYVDYAHPPDALETIWQALRPHTPGRLICLIGCGGDRDSRKRPVMGEIAARLSDLAVITDDNPRSEDPAQIRHAMMVGAGDKAVEVAGRRAAIRRAVEEMKEGDVLVVAGKGHEQGQLIGSIVEPFDDVGEVKKAMGIV